MLEINDLVSVFRIPGGKIRAVDGVDLEIAAGEVVCVVGESGCGKTALGLSVMGLMPGGAAAHPRGGIRFDGEQMVGAAADRWERVRGRRIGMIFQEPMTSLNPVMRIGDQVAEPLLIHKLATRTEAAERAIAALKSVGIPGPDRVVRQYPHELSGGMRQRAMIAAATIAGPELLIADEPTTALDVTIEAQIVELLLEMRERLGMAMLFITHDLGIVAQLADRVAVMYAGQIVELAPVGPLFAEPRHPYTEGLLASMPRPGRRRKRLAAIPGTVPQPQERPVGCRFAPRCPYRQDLCEEPVALVTPAEGRFTRCLRHDALGDGFSEEAS